MAEKATVLFDGVCNFCNSSVNFIIDRDKEDYFQFTPLQNDLAKDILRQNGYNPDDLDSVVLYEDGTVYTESTAALRIAKRLKGLWPLLYGFIIIPPFIRNSVYRFIARNRYKWFGKREACRLPSPEVKAKFIGM